MKRLVVSFVLVAFASVAAAPAAERPPARMAPWVTIAGVDVGGMTSERARAKLRTAYNRPLRFVFGKERWQARPTGLGATAAVDDAIAEGLRALAGERVPLRVEADRASIRSYVGRLSRLHSRPPQSSQLVGLAAGKPELTRSRPGRAVRLREMQEAIVQALGSTTRRPLPLLVRAVEPEVTRANFGSVIVIRRGSNVLDLYDGERHRRSFRVATGSAEYPSPLGTWSVVDKQRDPWWRPPDSEWAKDLEPVPPGPGNPLGTRWMGLSAPAVGIHGTPDAASIGYSASHGCIRMHISDATWLFDQVDLRTPVIITA